MWPSLWYGLTMSFSGSLRAMDTVRGDIPGQATAEGTITTSFMVGKAVFFIWGRSCFTDQNTLGRFWSSNFLFLIFFSHAFPSCALFSSKFSYFSIRTLESHIHQCCNSSQFQLEPGLNSQLYLPRSYRKLKLSLTFLVASEFSHMPWVGHNFKSFSRSISLCVLTRIIRNIQPMLCLL